MGRRIVGFAEEVLRVGWCLIAGGIAIQGPRDDPCPIVVDAPCHCNRRKQRAKSSHLTELDVLFSVLALLNASIGMVGLCFQCHSQTPMIRQQL